MNSIEKGNVFESKVRSIVEETIIIGQIGIKEELCKVFSKKGYYSKDREKEIIFDLSIEVWPRNAENYSFLVLIECKSYSSSDVPVSDVEEFYAKIDQVSGVNVKGIFITDSNFQSGAFNYARAKGMMLIVVNFDQSYNIVLYKTSQDSKEEMIYDPKLKAIRDLLLNGFSDRSNVEGLERLSTGAIETKAEDFVRSFNEFIDKSFAALDFNELISFVTNKLEIKIVKMQAMFDWRGKPILGYCDRQEKIIGIDWSIFNQDRMPFVLCHELGHFVLHNELKVNKEAYESFKDSEHNFVLGKHELQNPKHWIEWQANQFAASVILPRKSLIYKLIDYQESQGIRNKGTMYYDHQPVNIADFHETINYLSQYFKVTKTNVIFRLKALEILKYANDGPVHWTNYFKEY